MAQTNFRAQDMKKGKKAKEGKPAVREDNKVLNSEVDKAVDDPKAGNKVATKAAKAKKESEATIAEEISHVEELDAEDVAVVAPKQTRAKNSK